MLSKGTRIQTVSIVVLESAEKSVEDLDQQVDPRRGLGTNGCRFQKAQENRGEKKVTNSAMRRMVTLVQRCT